MNIYVNNYAIWFPKLPIPHWAGTQWLSSDSLALSSVLFPPQDLCSFAARVRWIREQILAGQWAELVSARSLPPLPEPGAFATKGKHVGRDLGFTVSDHPSMGESWQHWCVVLGIACRCKLYIVVKTNEKDFFLCSNLQQNTH